MAATLAKTLLQFPVVIVTGPRQIGKTTLMGELASAERTYVTLDDPLVREIAQRDPGLFLQRFAALILIDEVQYAPQLLPLIKMAHFIKCESDYLKLEICKQQDSSVPR